MHWLIFALALWILGGILQGSQFAPEVNTRGFLLTYLASATVPPLAYMVVEHFSRRQLPVWLRYAAWLIPAITIASALLPELQAYVWQRAPEQLSGQTLTTVDYGDWYNYVHIPFAYAITLFSLGLLVDHSMTLTPAKRLSALTIVILAALPILFSALRINGWMPASVTPTSTILALATPFVVYIVIRHEILLNDTFEYRRLFEQMHEAIVVVDLQDIVLALNSAAEQLFELNAEHVAGQPLHAVLPEMAEKLERYDSDGLQGSDLRFDHKHIAMRINKVERRHSDQAIKLLICNDVTNKYLATQALARNEELLRTLIHHSSNGIFRVRQVNNDSEHVDFEIVIANPAAADLFESPLEHIVGKTLGRLLFGDNVSDRQYALQQIVPTLHEATARGECSSLEFCLSHQGTKRWYRLLADPVGNDIGVTCVDITSEREQQHALKSAALRDPLTNVLNRRGFEQSVSRYLSQTEDNSTGALLFIDLNDFKSINDQHGHEIGDAILAKVADRLGATLRPSDITGRHGGDEFIVLIPETSAEEAHRLRERVDQALSAPYMLDSLVLKCGASIGMALYPDQAITLTALMRAADHAMYADKQQKRDSETGRFDALRVVD